MGSPNRVVTLGNPGHVEVTADRAKFVIPANYAFIQKGRPANETGSMNPPAMPKGAAGWRITGWAWSES
jgi:hypothetical protein